MKCNGQVHVYSREFRSPNISKKVIRSMKKQHDDKRSDIRFACREHSTTRKLVKEL